MIGADISAYKAAMLQAGKTAEDISSDITKSLAQVARANATMGGSAQSMSMRFMQMRSGLSAVRDGAMAAFVGGQRADMMFMAMGHHFTSLINETGSLKGAFGALGASLLGPGGIIIGLTLAYELFNKFGGAEKDAYDATKNFASALDAQKQVASNLDESYAKAVSNVAELTENVKLAKDGFISKTEVVKEYNDTLGKTMGSVKTLAEVEQKLVEGAPDYIKMMLYKAAAQTALKEASDKALEAAKVALKPQEEFKPNAFVRFALGAGGSSAPGAVPGQAPVSAAKVQDDINKIADENRAKEKQKYTDDQNTLLKIFNDFQDKAASIAGQHHWSFMPQDDPKAEKAKDGFKAIEAEIDKIKVKLEDATIQHQPTVAHQLAMDLMDAQQKLDKLKQTYANSLLAGGGAKPLTASGVTTLDNNTLLGEDTGQNGGENENLIQQDDALKTLGAEMEHQVKHHKDVQDAIFASQAAGRNWKTEIKDENTAIKELSRAVGTGLMSAFQGALSGTQNFVSAMGHFLAQLIEKLIAAAAAAAILAVLLDMTGFGAALGAGASFGSIFGQLSGLGTIVGGAASGGSSSSGMGMFATGGIFTTPRVGMFAEAGPEAIVTPKHLAEFAGVQQNGSEMSVTHRISGPDLLLTITRANKQKGRLS